MTPPEPNLYRLPAPDWRLLEGDVLEQLRAMPDASVDSIVTDPPYGIDFDGQGWDGADIRRRARQPGQPKVSNGEAFERFTTAWATECLRVLKPGGHLAAFGAARMVHRLVAGVEDAGFDVRDQLLWVYGSGLPKSPKLPGGRGTALKPGYEPILLARRPPEGTVTATIARHGTGGLNIEASKVPEYESGGGTVWRWPANLLVSHHEDCGEACDGDCPRALIDQAQPERPPSRLFYCPKPSSSEREAGCSALPEQAFQIFGKGGTRPRRNVHPTVKPIELMRWLVRLITPVDGLVLDPFTGSGSTGGAALMEGRRFVGIEREPAYVTIAKARIEHWHRQAADPRQEGRAA